MGRERHTIENNFYEDVARGLFAQNSIMSALGERESIGTTSTGEDIWRGNELASAPTSHTTIPTPAAAGEQMRIVSESAADNGTSATGVLVVRLAYLDASGDEQTEDVTIDGTTGVNTAATDIRFVNDMYAISVGSGGIAAGHIYLHKTGTAGLVYNMIAAGGNKSLVPHRMVPRAKVLVLKGWGASEGGGKRVNVRLRSTDMSGVLRSGVFCFKGETYLNQSTSPEMALNIAVPALSIVKVSGWAAALNAEVGCHWWGILENT